MYQKTLKKLECRKNIDDENKIKINMLFDEFITNYHKSNFEYLNNKAKSLFGPVDKAVIDDVLQDIYLSMLLIEEEKLLQMDILQLLKVFRSIVGGVSTTGNLYQRLKYTRHQQIEEINQ